MVRRTFPQRNAPSRLKGLRAERRQRRLRRLRLEWLEPRRVLDALGAEAYGAVSAAWFAAVPQIVAGVEDAPAIDLSAVFGPVQADRPAQATRWIVRLTEAATATAGSVQPAEHLLDTLAADFQVLRGLGLPGQVLVRSFAPDDIARAALAGSDHVAAFEPERIVLGPQGDPPDDPLFAQQWGLENTGQTGGTPDADIDALGAWDMNTGSPSVVVGVVDSGVDYTHPDLYLNVAINQGEIPDPFASQIAQIDVDGDGLITFYDLNDPDNAGLVAERADDGNEYIDGGDLLLAWSDGLDTDGNSKRDDLIGWDFQGNDNNPRDEHRHGTHVAGTIAALGDNGLGVAGINRAVSLLPLKFLNANNQGFPSDAVAAVNYATLMRTQRGMNVRVTNNSWVSGTEPDEALRDAIEAAGAADILFVAAAGNGDILGRGIDLDADPYYPAAYDLDNILSVAATDHHDKLARFSNYGLQSVDIAAPGVAIWSTEPGGQYGSRNGTSMAAPHVTGTAALVWSRVPQATAAEVREAILRGADPIAGLQSKIAGGRRLNALGALLVDSAAPQVISASVEDITGPGISDQRIEVTYHDDRAVDVSSLDAADIVVTRLWDSEVMPGIVLEPPQVQEEGRTVVAVYRLPAPDGTWGTADAGDYEVVLQPDQLSDASGNRAASSVLGRFNVDATEGLYRVNSPQDAADAAPGDGAADDGAGHTTLRAAVMEASQMPGPNTIRLPAGRYEFGLAPAGEDGAATGDLDVSGELTVRGAGADRTVIDAAGLDRVFHVRAGATLHLIGLTITGGLEALGAGLYVESGARVVMSQVAVEGNSASDRGGGIYNLGSLEISSSTIAGNAAAERGGGLFNAGSAAISNSTISGNTAPAAGSLGGGVFNAQAATLYLIHCTVVDNSAHAGGGLDNDGAASVSNTILALNAAEANADIAGFIDSVGYNLGQYQGGRPSNTVSATATVIPPVDEWYLDDSDDEARYEELDTATIHVDAQAYLGGYHRYEVSATPSAVARWSVELVPGTYEVFVAFVADPQFPASAEYRVYDGTAAAEHLLQTVQVDQRQAPDLRRSADGHLWEPLGEYTVSNGGLVVELLNAGDGQYVCADAIWVRLPRPGDPPLIDSLTATPEAVELGQTSVLLAGGVRDPDGEVVRVDFYRDENGNGRAEAEEQFGQDSQGSDGWSLILPAVAPFVQGYHTLLAVAVDDEGLASTPAVRTVQVVGPEARVEGMGIEIVNGDLTPGAGDGTDFGSGSGTRTFVIRNTGNAALHLTGVPLVQIVGDAGFTVTQPPAQLVCAGCETSFTVRYRPPVTGLHTATVLIPNDDWDESTYSFAIAGTYTADFGDAPGPYPTLLANQGAWHRPEGPTLGANRDTEFDGVPAVNADGDDAAGAVDDEDGITWGGPFVAGQAGSVTVNVQNAAAGAKLDAWIDFNRDGDWNDASEQIAANTVMVNGDNVLSLAVPGSAVEGPTYARFRLSTGGGLGPTGLAEDGEVEDWALAVDRFETDANVRGNGLEIVHGDTTPSGADGTDFGRRQVSGGRVFRDFTIQNVGEVTLHLTGATPVTLSGPHAGDFAVQQPSAGTLAPGESTTFRTVFYPLGAGVRTATFHIASDDPDEPSYEFAIQGTGDTAANNTIVINEITFNSYNEVELHNTGTNAVDLTGWQLVGNYYPGGTPKTWTLPSYALGPGGYVVLHESSGTNDAQHLYFNSAMYLYYWESGSAALIDAAGTGVDFVRWGDSTEPPPAGTYWSGPDPGDGTSGKSLGRDFSSTDTDAGDDWTWQPATLGRTNRGIFVNPVSGLLTTELGQQATFTISLGTAPAADVTIALTSGDTSEGTVSPGSVTFTPSNWATAQTVTVIGQDDLDIDGHIAYTIVTSATVSSDSSYNGLLVPDVQAENLDDDGTPSVGFSPSSRTIEEGSVAYLNVELSDRTGRDVTVLVSTQDGTAVAGQDYVAVSDTFVIPAGAWSVAVPIGTIEGPPTESDENFCVILVEADGATIVGDTAEVTIAEDDGLVGVVTFEDTTVFVQEGDAEYTTLVVTIYLWAPLPEGVTLYWYTDEGSANAFTDFLPDQGFPVLSPEMVFAAVYVTLLGDQVHEPAEWFDLVLMGNSFEIDRMQVVILDDDPVGIVSVPPSGNETTEGGGTAGFTVALASEPLANVTVGLQSSDLGEGAVSPSTLTFTPSNWSTPQVVTIAGVDDGLYDGDVAYTVGLTVSSTDPNYGGLIVAPLSAVNLDDDDPRIIDDGDAEFAVTGDWLALSQAGVGYQDDLHRAEPGDGSRTARWTFAVEPGHYQISATWPPGADLATDAPYVIYDDVRVLATHRVNQQLAPNDCGDQFLGGQWEVLDIVTIWDGDLVVELRDDADGRVVADAIRVRPVAPGFGEPPVVGSLAVSAEVANRGETLTLTAQGVADTDGDVIRVEFWLDTNGNGQVDAEDVALGTDTTDDDGWSLTFDSTAVEYGPVQFIAQAADTGGNGWLGTDLLGLDPLLGPLADNGGSTRTHEPRVGSPAIDGGDPADLLAVDQRGIARPQDGSGGAGNSGGLPRTDIGAVEQYHAAIHGIRFHDVNGDGDRDLGEDGLVGLPVYLDSNGNEQLDANEPVALTRDDDPATIDVDEAGTYSFVQLAPGTYAVSEVLATGWQQTPGGFGSGVERVSLGWVGTTGNQLSYGQASLSADGRFTAFASAAADLVPDDTNGEEDIFVYDQQTGWIERVSVAADGAQANAWSAAPAISDDGRYVTFQSHATNLVPDDTNGKADVFVYDRQTRSIQCVSRPAGGAAAGLGNGSSSQPAISADGRFVAFTSEASNLVASDFNGVADVFLLDRQEQELQWISSGGNAWSASPSISAYGDFVAFESAASNLAAGQLDGNAATDIWLYDRQQGLVQRVSHGQGGVEQGANGNSSQPAISADGQSVAFASDASNLVTADTNGQRDVFVYRRQTGTVQRVSVGREGQEANGPSGDPVVSGLGQYVAFRSSASNLVSGDTNARDDVFAADLQAPAPAVTRLSVSSGGEQGDGASVRPAISADGARVAFLSEAGNLFPQDTNHGYDVFVHGRTTGLTDCVSVVARAGLPANDDSDAGVISADGRYVAFSSAADNLVPGDTNGHDDIFVYDRRNDTIQRVSVGWDGFEANRSSADPSISSDGRWMAFVSLAANLVPLDTNNHDDVFVYDRQTQTTQRVSLAADGSQAAEDSFQPAISPDGRYVAFASYAALVPEDTNAVADVYLYDCLTRHIELVSVAGDGTPGNGPSDSPAVSSAGARVAFRSSATNLDARDTNARSDVFVRTRGAQSATALVSIALGGPGAAAGNDASAAPAISADGRYVAFYSRASDLVPDDGNTAEDIFVRDLDAQATEIVSVTSDGTQANGYSAHPSLSGDGRFVSFSSLATNLASGDANGSDDVFVYDRRDKILECVSSPPAGTSANDHAEHPALSADGRYVLFDSAASNLVPGDLNGRRDVFAASTRVARLPRPAWVTLSAGEVVDDVDFADRPLPGEIHGEQFLDFDGDGIRDPGEPALTGWEIYLDANANGTLDADERSAVTDVNGQYAFLGLPTRTTYVVAQVPRGQWVQTYPRPADGGVWTIALAAGQIATAVDFGSFFRGPTGQDTEAIRGRYFQDGNGNGRQDAGETGWASQTVYLDLNNNGVLDGADVATLTQTDNPATADVDETGLYSFESLGNGTYTVRAVPASDSTQTTPLDPQLSALHYGTGILDQSQAVAAGDLDGDGDSDLIVAHGNYVSWLANDGTGSFAAPNPIPAYSGIAAWSLAAEDFDADGDLDLAVASYMSSNVAVLLNDGDAGFTLGANHTVGVYPHAVTAGDLDRDGDVDLAVALEWDGTLAILRNGGQGAFTLDAAKPASGTNPFNVVSAQFNDDNADGRSDDLDALDLVIANFGNPLSTTDMGNVAVLLNNGNGQFATRVEVPAGENPACIAAADLDLDGDLDLAVADFGSSDIAIMVNLGNGSFVRLPNTFLAGAGPYALTAGDLDHDGDPDLIVTNGTEDHLAVLRNDSQDGTIAFAAPQSVGVANFPDSLSFGVAVQDLNDDGDLDLAVANGTGNNVSVMLNQVVQGAHRVTLNGMDAFTGLDFGVQPDDSPPTISQLDDQSTPEGRTVGPLALTIGDLETPLDELVLTAVSDNGTLVPDANIVLEGTGANRTITLTPAPEQTGTSIITVTVSDGIRAISESFQVIVTPMMTVASFVATSTGFVAGLNHDVAAGVLNLYDQGGALGPADVTVTGATVGPVRGSLVVDPGLRKIAFIKTGGPLEADTYTVTLVSGANAFRDADGNVLDENGDGTGGDSYTATFVAPPPANGSVTVSLPDFARGYGQSVNLPANNPAAGLPLQLSDGAGVSRLQFTLRYESSLLELQAFTLSSSLVERGAQAQFQAVSPGEATLSVTATSGLAATSGPLTVGSFTAAVPATAAYGAKHVLDITGLHVFDDSPEPQELPALDDDAIHVAAFFGDNNGSRTYNAPDVTLNQRLIGLINTGLSAYQLADPLLLADITRNGQLQANDTVSIQRVIGQVPVANVPALPTGLTPPAASGADPKIYIPQNLSGWPGDTVTAPVKLLVTEAAGITLSGFDLVVEYDPAVLTVTAAQLGGLLAGSGFSGSLSYPAPGKLIYTAASPTGTGTLAFQSEGDLVRLTCTINAAASAGPSTLNLLASYGATVTAAFNNDLEDLVLQPAPTNASNDSVDGRVQVKGTISVSFTSASQTGGEQSGTMTVTAELSASHTQDVIVPFTLSGTATAGVGQDYAITPSPITIPAGQTRRDITIAINNDLIVEGDETVIVTLGVPTNAVQGAITQHTATIADDDVPGFALSKTTAAVSEDETSQTFTVVLTAKPLSNVVFDVSSANTAEVTVSPAQVTFTPGGWDTSVTVTLTGVNDAPPVMDGDQVVDVTVAVNAAGSDNAWDGLAAKTVAVTNQDNDLPGFTLSKTAASVSEDETSETFTVVLTAKPLSNVVLDVSSANTNEVTASPAQVTFTPGGWDTPVTVTVAGVNDVPPVVDGEQVVDVTVAVNAAGSDDAWDALAAKMVAVTNEDNDLPGYTLSKTTASVSEDGTSQTFTVVLTAQPLSNVVFDVSSANTNEVTISPAQVTFTPGGWDTPVTVALTGVNDAPPVVDGDQTVDVTVAVNAAESDNAWDGLVAKMVAVTNEDNDLPGFTLSKTAAAVSEDETSQAFTVVLTAKPLSNVVFDVSNANTAEVTVSPAQVTFAPEAWDTPVTVKLTGVNDVPPVVDGDQAVDVTVAVNAAGSDDAWDSLVSQTVAVVNEDNDGIGFTLSETTATVSENGISELFTMVLRAKPLTNVVFDVSSANTAEVAATPVQVTFAPEAWDTPVTVTVTGVNDVPPLVDGDQVVDVTVAVNAAGSDNAWDSLAAKTVAVTNQDNDVPGFTLSETAASVSEDETSQTFTVVLTAKPVSNVVFDVSSANTAEVAATPVQVTFAPEAWDTPVTVALTGVNDMPPLVDGDQVIDVTVAVNAAGSDNAWDSLAAKTVAVTNQDNDVPGFTLSETAASVSEDETSQTFTVVLTAKPVSNVVFDVSSANMAEVTVSPAHMTFAPEAWDTPLTVTLTGVNDVPPLVDGDQVVDLTVAVNAAGSDNAWDSLAAKTVAVTNQDNDVPSFTLSETAASVSEDETSQTFTVVLTAKPLSNVMFDVSSANTNEVTVSPVQVTFAPEAWDTPVTVTVTGVNDVPPVVDGDQLTSVTVGVDLVNSDDHFDAVTHQVVWVTTVDNDVSWFNALNPFDVDASGRIEPKDVLLIINYITNHPDDPSLPPAPASPPPFYDVNNDGFCTSADALLVINYINGHGTGSGGEGENASPEAAHPHAGFPVPRQQAASLATDVRMAGITMNPAPAVALIPTGPATGHPIWVGSHRTTVAAPSRSVPVLDAALEAWELAVEDDLLAVLAQDVLGNSFWGASDRADASNH